MELWIFYNHKMQHQQPSCYAFAAGALNHGVNVRHLLARHFYQKKDKGSPDMVVIFGTGSVELGTNALIKQHIVNWCIQRKIQFVIIEEGHIKRGEYWNVTIGGLLKDGRYTHPDIDLNRIDSVTKFKPFEWSGDQILLCRQIPRDAAVRGFVTTDQYENWIQSIVNQLFPYPLKIREHPRITATKGYKTDPPLEIELEHTRMVITYSSTSATDAIVHGVPVYIEQEKHLASELSIPLNKIDDEESLPSFEKQHRVLNEVVHAQWSLYEMQSGKCWEHIMKIIRS